MENNSENSSLNEKKKLIKLGTPAMEEMVCGYLLNDRNLFMNLAQYLKTDDWRKDTFFNDVKYQIFINTYYSYNKKYNKFPHKDVMFAVIENIESDPSSDSLKENLKKTFNHLMSKDYSEYSQEYIRDITTDFIRKQRAIEATLKCVSEINNDRFDNLDDIIRKAVNVNLDKDLGLSLKDYSRALPLIQEVQDENKGCTWGSATLDRELGRIQPGELGVFAGVPGAGKTAWLGHVGQENMAQDKNIVMFSFEVDQKRLSARFYKSIFKWNSNQLLNAKPDDVKKAMESVKGDIRIICRPANTCSSNDMAGIIQDLIVYENFTPDLILVDYILITSTNNKSRDSNDTYKYYKTVSEELRNLAVEFSCPVVTACQINRAGMGEKGGSKATLTSKDISESRGVIDSADYVLMIEQTAEDKYKNDTKGVYRIRSDKNRNGRSGFAVDFEVDWNNFRISEKSK